MLPFLRSFVLQTDNIVRGCHTCAIPFGASLETAATNCKLTGKSLLATTANTDASKVDNIYKNTTVLNLFETVLLNCDNMFIHFRGSFIN